MKYFEQTTKQPVFLASDYVPVGHLPVYFDIETTGLSARSCLIYLIASIEPNESAGEITFRQWFAENPDEEASVIAAFLDSLPENAHLCHFNGANFDIPFVRARADYHGIPWKQNCAPLTNSGFDFYRTLTPLYYCFDMPGQSQKEYEKMTGFDRTDPYDGGQLIEFYRQYVGIARFDKDRSTFLLDSMLCHNREDLYGMYSLLTLFPMLECLRGNFRARENRSLELSSEISDLRLDCLQPSSADFSADCSPLPSEDFFKGCSPLPSEGFSVVRRNDTLVLSRSFSHPVPEPMRRRISRALVPLKQDGERNEVWNVGIDLEISTYELHLSVPILSGTYKYFFSNYKDYFFLPAEGKVVHKSLGESLAREARVRAKREQAYQPLSGEFLPGTETAFSQLFRTRADDLVALSPVPADLSSVDVSVWNTYASHLLERFCKRN